MQFLIDFYKAWKSISRQLSLHTGFTGNSKYCIYLNSFSWLYFLQEKWLKICLFYGFCSPVSCCWSLFILHENIRKRVFFFLIFSGTVTKLLNLSKEICSQRSGEIHFHAPLQLRFLAALEVVHITPCRDTRKCISTNFFCDRMLL